MRTLLALFFILILLTAPALAGTATITIFGTNASNAQANLTNTGNQSINVTAWNVGGIKTFKVNVTNASDTLTFNLYNVTAGQVNEFKINGTAINGYQADSNGLITFTRTQGTGNSTFNLAPAVQQGGYNTTWAYIQNLVVQTATTIYNVAIYNATQVQGDGSGLSNLNRSNVTGQIGVDDAQNVTEAALQANDTYFNGTVFPQSTEFKNSTAVTANNTANIANTTANNAEPAISQGVSPQFWMFNKTWQNITTTWITEGVNLWFTNARAVSAVQSIFDAMNQSSAANNTASQGRDDAINNTKVNKTDLNSTIQVNRSQVTGQEGVDTGQNTSNVNQDTNLTNFQGYVNNTALPTKADATFVNSSNRIDGGFSFYDNSVALGNLGINVSLPYSGTLVGVSMWADRSGNVTINIYNRSSDITGGNNLILNNAQEMSDTILTGWNTTVTTSERFRFNISSFDTISNLNILFTVRRT